MSVIDTATNKVTATINGVGSGPGVNIEGVAVTPDGSKVYVTNEGDSFNPVSVIDTATDKVTATIPISSGDVAGTFGVAVTPDGSKVYITNAFTNRVSVIDAATNTVIATIGGVGSAPEGVAVTPDGSKVYVANTLSNTVSVIDAATNTVIGSPIPVGVNPVAFGVFIQPAPRFAGIPGHSNCYGKSVSALAQRYGGLNAAAAALGYPSVKALQTAVMEFCEG